MVVKVLIKKKTLRSSVQLMTVSRELNAMPGIIVAAALMGTKANKKLATDIGALNMKGLDDCTEQDVIVFVKGRDEKTVAKAINKAEELLATAFVGTAQSDQSLEKALAKLPSANLVLISLPGKMAVQAAKEALHRGLHVHLFSDNISIQDEIDLKELALSMGLLMMGPDCGTAIINGVPLGFANAVRQGCIGIVSASGTGLQEVSCLLDRAGAGVSQGIGVGGRDLSSAVDGIMMQAAMKALDNDPQTKVVVAISKPPSTTVFEKISACALGMRKPVIMCLIGGERMESGSIQMVSTLEEAARQALAQSGEKNGGLSIDETDDWQRLADDERSKLQNQQKFIRGLFVGGTLCSEAVSILCSQLGRPVFTNIDFPGVQKLEDVNVSVEDACIDLGDDMFTRGMVHPMIDPTVRNLRLIKEGQDPNVAVVLLDIVLGYGAHKDPAGSIIPIIKDVQSYAKKEGRYICFVASVLGTDQDPQNRRYTVARLKDAGVIVGESNAQAVKIALSITRER